MFFAYNVCVDILQNCGKLGIYFKIILEGPIMEYIFFAL